LTVEIKKQEEVKHFYVILIGGIFVNNSVQNEHPFRRV